MPFPVDAKWIAETESKLGVRFPASYVVAMSKMNGGGDALVLKPMVDDPTTLEHTVYWWDHETSELHRAADDFSELNKT